MAATARKKAEAPAKVDNSVSLFVSLYLVVLAFFILLNSISKVQQKKSEEAMQSLTETFAEEESDVSLPFIEKSAGIGSQVSTDGFFAPVGKLAKEMLSLTDADVVETGNTMVLTIPVSTFYVKDSDQIQGKQNAFMNTLADQLTKMAEGTEVNVEFSIGLLIGAQVGNPNASQDVRLGMLRAGNFARVLTSMGVNDRAIYVGLMPERDPKTIQMTFTAKEKPTTKQKPL
jgi:hypothetical protein